MIDSNAPVILKIKFMPNNPQSYEYNLPVYLDSNDKPYTSIVVKGEGAYPRLLFDRREVIMPVVPLGIESFCTFRIYNEGYQKMDINLNVPKDLGGV